MSAALVSDIFGNDYKIVANAQGDRDDRGALFQIAGSAVKDKTSEVKDKPATGKPKKSGGRKRAGFE